MIYFGMTQLNVCVFPSSFFFENLFKNICIAILCIINQLKNIVEIPMEFSSAYCVLEILGV